MLCLFIEPCTQIRNNRALVPVSFRVSETLTDGEVTAFQPIVQKSKP